MKELWQNKPKYNYEQWLKIHKQFGNHINNNSFYHDDVDMIKKYSEDKKEKIKNPKIYELFPLTNESSEKYLNENILQNQ